MTDAEDPLRAARLAKLEGLRELGIDPYPYAFARTDEAIQIFCHRDHLDPQNLAAVRLLDIGDLIGVEGLVRRTPRGELTVNATAVSVLAKTLRPLPEKYHGLADVELRYRQRYLDLIMNPESRDTLRRRSRIVGCLGRRWEAVAARRHPDLQRGAELRRRDVSGGSRLESKRRAGPVRLRAATARRRRRHDARPELQGRGRLRVCRLPRHHERRVDRSGPRPVLGSAGDRTRARPRARARASGAAGCSSGTTSRAPCTCTAAPSGRLAP